MAARQSPAAWPAPAKLNLFLHVLSRREDGYHELQTGIQFLDWCDWLDFRVTDDGRITRRGNAGVTEGEDLVVRAARLLQRRAAVPRGAGISIDKRLPRGGGLGGGSSDAATTLVALNALWETGLVSDELAALGLELGADVPVFVRGHAALVEGIGERITAADPPECWYVVVDPAVSVSTGEVFGAPELTRNSPRTKIPRFASGTGRNDLEPVVRARFPAVAAALDWLGRQAPARLTGSGGCIFAPMSDRRSAEAVAASVPKPWRARAARGVNRSPLLARLDALAG